MHTVKLERLRSLLFNIFPAIIKVKVQFTLEQAAMAQIGSRGTALNLGARWGGCGQRHDPAALPSGKTGYPLFRKLGGPQGRSGLLRKIPPPPGFDPRTIQPVVSSYTDYAIEAHFPPQYIAKIMFRLHNSLLLHTPQQN
jgi:hypothetical protein